MNLTSRQFFKFLTKFPKASVPSNAAGVLGFHNGIPNLATTDAVRESKLPVPEVSPSEIEEPDKLYKLIELEMRANQKQLLQSYEKFLTMAANGLGVEIGNSWGPRKPNFHRFTVLRSAFVHKRCRVQYEYRTYYWFMSFQKLTGSTADTFLEYIERNLPEGLALKVTKVAVEKVPEHLVPGGKEETSNDKSS